MHAPMQHLPRDGARTAPSAGTRAVAAAPASLGSMAWRMNAGPHAASLSALQAVVAQRACADCEHVRRAMGTAAARSAAPPGVVQRVLILGNADEQGDRTLPVIQELLGGTGAGMARNHPLRRLLGMARKEDRGDVLGILHDWATDDAEHRERAWADAVQAAKAELARRRWQEGLSPDKRAEQARSWAALQERLAAAGAGQGQEWLSELKMPEDEQRNLARIPPELRREASVETDAMRDVVPVDRRKRDREGQSAGLPGGSIAYRSAAATLSTRNNHFIVGGSAKPDYAGLFGDLVAAASAERREMNEAPLTDRQLAELFLQELDGADAFAGFSPGTRALAHHIILIIGNAELSRHSIAPVSAAAAFHGIARRPEEVPGPGLVASFATGSDALRPFFAGAGGPKLMRGEPTDLGDAETARRNLRGTVDILNYHRSARLSPDEDVLAFVRRRTREIITSLHGRPGAAAASSGASAGAASGGVLASALLAAGEEAPVVAGGMDPYAPAIAGWEHQGEDAPQAGDVVTEPAPWHPGAVMAVPSAPAAAFAGGSAGYGGGFPHAGPAGEEHDAGGLHAPDQAAAAAASRNASATGGDAEMLPAPWLTGGGMGAPFTAAASSAYGAMVPAAAPFLAQGAAPAAHEDDDADAGGLAGLSGTKRWNTDSDREESEPKRHPPRAERMPRP